MTSPKVLEAFAAIDAANAEDPNLFDGQPRALLQGTLATAWTARLVSSPSDEVLLATRAHHLKRWELARAEYPEGRAGYLKWRLDNKKHQANAAASILSELGFDEPTIARVSELLLRKGLGTDPETQLLEDAACLVFLETQFEPLIDRLDADKAINAVAKTLAKMSPEALALSAEVDLSVEAQAILQQASS